MSDIQLHSRVEIEQLRDELRRMHARLAKLEARRPPNPVHPLDIRWAITKKREGIYPTFAANTFPIRFLDPDFTASAGLQTMTAELRQKDTDTNWTYAHAGTGNWIPQDLPIPVFRQRGLGDDDAGDWWILDPPKAYFGKLRGSLSSGGTGSVEIWLYQSGWKKTDCVVGALDWFLKTGTIPIWSRVRIEWNLTTWVITNAACSADDPPAASSGTGYGSGADPLAGAGAVYSDSLFSPQLFASQFAAGDPYLDRY